MMLTLRNMAALAIAVLLIAGCTSESSPEATSTATTSVAPTVTVTPLPTIIPTPRPAFEPGPIIMPTVGVPTHSPATHTPAPATADSFSDQLDMIGYITAVLRELPTSGSLRKEFRTKEELSLYLRENLEEDLDRVYQSQELYVTLGILDRDTDYMELLLGLIGENIFGFFDAEVETMFVDSDDPEMSPRNELTVAHEFVHSLQQQHFDIHATREALKVNSDMSRAFSALREGDATLSEIIYLSERLDEDEQAEVREGPPDSGSSNISEIPHVIRRALQFPYRAGPQFVYALYLEGNGWDIVNRSFEEVPLSTEQILHPEKYISGEAPVTVQLPEFVAALGQGWTELRRDTLGELIILAYLETDLTPEQAFVAADGWGGDTYALLEGPEGDNLLVSVITWDAADDAREFFETFLAFMQTRTGAEWSMPEDNDMAQVIALPDQIVYLKLDALNTILIYAPNDQSLESAKLTLESGI